MDIKTYNEIIDPTTGKKHSVYNPKGMNIIKGYIKEALKEKIKEKKKILKN